MLLVRHQQIEDLEWRQETSISPDPPPASQIVIDRCEVPPSVVLTNANAECLHSHSVEVVFRFTDGPVLLLRSRESSVAIQRR
jgi:hypothetical protein